MTGSMADTSDAGPFVILIVMVSAADYQVREVVFLGISMKVQRLGEGSVRPRYDPLCIRPSSDRSVQEQICHVGLRISMFGGLCF